MEQNCSMSRYIPQVKSLQTECLLSLLAFPGPQWSSKDKILHGQEKKTKLAEGAGQAYDTPIKLKATNDVGEAYLLIRSCWKVTVDEWNRNAAKLYMQYTF